MHTCHYRIPAHSRRVHIIVWSAAQHAKSRQHTPTARWSRGHAPKVFDTPCDQLPFISTLSLSARAPLEASSSPCQHTAHRGHLKYAPLSHLYAFEVLRPHLLLKAFRSPCTTMEHSRLHMLPARLIYLKRLVNPAVCKGLLFGLAGLRGARTRGGR